MNQFPLFSSGLELASVVVAADLLRHSWDSILDLYRESAASSSSSTTNEHSVKVKASQLQYPKFTILAFAAKTHLQQEGGGGMVSSESLRENFPLFEFLCTESNPSFSIHKAAITLFASALVELTQLKNQCANSSPLIITGHSLGGSVASLFTLWLLESIDPSTTKRPLCITFGSPLLGDSGLQRAISEWPTWKSCFLHVVSDQDPVPRHFITPWNTQSDYKPFGPFLLCSGSGCACIDDSELVLELLEAMDYVNNAGRSRNGGLQVVDYKTIVDDLMGKILVKSSSEVGQGIDNSLQVGIITQLEAMGINRLQNSNIDTLVERMEKHEKLMQKRKVFDPAKKLNDIKRYMAQLEWYKKKSKYQNIGYYDSYKNGQSKSDREVSRLKKILTNYWKEMVAEAEKKPQKEGAAFQLSWLYAGTNYRRMVEPLDIAEFYKDHHKRDYLKSRSKHYTLLERWQKNDKMDTSGNNKHEKKISCSLTLDSCFWANVEEAIIDCTLLKRGEFNHEEGERVRESLTKFEQYLMESIEKYAVSSEAFLQHSSLMKWWREYEMIIGNAYSSPLVEFMKNQNYQRYI